MTKFLKDSSSEFIDYCINFKNKLSNGNILISKARKFLSHHKFSGRNSNNNREQILDIIQQFLNGTNYYVNDDILPEEFFSGKILLDIKNELKDFNITREQFYEYTTYLIKSHNRIQKFFSIRAKYRKENIDDIYEIMTICNNKIPLTKTSLFFDFIIKLCNDKFLVTNYITNGSQLILICDKLHKYSVSKIHLDKRISENKNPCGICGEDTSGNNIFLRNKVYNTEQTIKSILYNKNIEFISYCSNSRMVNVKCPLCREDKAVHSCNIKSWNGCIKCSNEICGNKYTDNEINRICSLKGITKFTTYINKDVPIGYRCPKCMCEVYKRLHDILYKDNILCTYCKSSSLNYNEKSIIKHTIDIYGLEHIFSKDKQISVSDYLNIDYNNIDTTILINKILKKGRSISESSFELSKLNSHNIKPYQVSNNKILYLQGYEPQVIDILLNKLHIDESDIEVDSTNIPKFNYVLEGKQYRYFPDIFIPSFNLIIEVKSIYTYLSDKKRTNLKLLSVVSQGCNVQLWIPDKQDLYIMCIKLNNHTEDRCIEYNYFIYKLNFIECSEYKNYISNINTSRAKYECTLADYNKLQDLFNTMWLNLYYTKKPRNKENYSVLKYAHNDSTIKLYNHENIDFTQFINNGVIYINRIIFQKLKTNPSEHSINIMNLLESIKDPLLPIISDKECYNDYENIKADHTQVIENSISSNKNGRHKFLNKIMFPVMIKGKKYNKISYFDAWNDMCYRKKLVDRMLEKDYLMNNNSLYSCHACTYGIVYNFPPNVAKCLYNYFHATRVLDFCAGYGGRLTGFWTSNAKEYVGIDPNKNIPYNKVIEKLKQYDEQDKKVTIINECAEEVDYSSFGKFDFIFTSPPYFNTEIYSDDKCQSSFKYQEFKIWLENFLFKTLSKVSEVIINTGILAINIKDTPKYNIIQPMIEFIVSLGFVQCPSILLGQPKRYKNTKSEYIYIFLKN